ncbi:preprotein translocase subunit SecG [Candidatus Woesebacteria bacterium CG_4_10_14_0_2_um_filter_39_14]|uniref:Protein-export membrane protein SecG n=3 Tax=Microgenomates group TaxID=1794810 RepID=A0A2M6YQ50_9BACT|nr:MAG: preprotein translocase subunit SecG [Candidatus Shapirobacteria bacterium CG07_land_8_20_14_0_80_39_12]PIZ48527.1 MAG: preprotein translocase subunit SecG [Candidatus Woesebacteria bacterium CG_4_10_14_0_2_um_filter_39_14]PJA49826.1 MAG: preprotein translocase subunit SecG [Candidatus Shapirobacteria bacterium CG_4_9_14_3_um_filter_39_13]
MVFLLIQILIAVLLIVAVLIQARGAGLGEAWGGSSEFFTSRRGMEKIIFLATIVLAALFFLSSIVSLILR